MLSAAIFLIMWSGFSRLHFAGCAPSILMPFSAARSVGSSVVPAGNLLSLKTYDDDVARLLRRQRAGSVGRHRRMHAIEEIGERQVVPVAEELEADERRARFAARQVRPVAAGAAFVGHRFPALGLFVGIHAAPTTLDACAGRAAWADTRALEVTARRADDANTTAAAPTTCVHFPVITLIWPRW